MHFDQRTQQALREAGLDTAEIEAVSEAVVEATREAADALESFFADRETVYSDMDMAHSAGDTAEHTVEYCDLFTHAADIRGYLRFSTWGVPVEGGRVLDGDVIELSLGPTIDDRVRFAPDSEAL
jgi:hypothetical protein